MATLNYTTTVNVDRTVGEVTKILAKAGAARVSTDYDQRGRAVGIGFMLTTPHGSREFTLAVDIEGVHELLRRDPAVQKRGVSFTTVSHAERVAWRVVKDWLEAQLALIAANMASLDQVMLPFLVVANDGSTLYDAYRARETAALEM